jgi:hypothetical protein
MQIMKANSIRALVPYVPSLCKKIKKRRQSETSFILIARTSHDATHLSVHYGCGGGEDQGSGRGLLRPLLQQNSPSVQAYSAALERYIRIRTIRYCVIKDRYH